MAVTLQAIAETVGLSPMTVSRALRGVDRINPETRRRVRIAAQRLGYQPVRSVMFPPSRRQAGTQHTLRVLLPTVSRRIGEAGGAWYLDRMVAAVRERLKLSNGRLNEQHFLDIESLLSECKRGRYHGVILRQPLPHAWVERLMTVAAVVYAVEFDHQTGVDSVYSNEHRSAAMILDHLTGLGHRHVAWFGILDRHAPHQVIYDHLDDSLATDRQAFSVHGARHAAWANLTYCQLSDHQHRLVLVERDWRTESLEDVATRGLERILAAKTRPTAIVCSCDPLALCLMDLLRDRGLRVPRDMSLLCYGDAPETRAAEPPITTVNMPMETIGRVLPELIERRMADPHATPISVQFETTLGEGGSVGPPPR